MSTLKGYKEYRFKFKKSAWYWGDAINEDSIIANTEAKAYEILLNEYALKKEDVELLYSKDFEARPHAHMDMGDNNESFFYNIEEMY